LRRGGDGELSVVTLRQSRVELSLELGITVKLIRLVNGQMREWIVVDEVGDMGVDFDGRYF
jgi:hypothetical protein